MTATITKQVKEGDRIGATIYGVPRLGTVIRIGQHGGAIFVIWDGNKRESFVHQESLTSIN